MANEAEIVVKFSEPVGMIVSNTTGIEKGVILKGADPFTVAASTAAVDNFGGILAVEKIANDGVTVASVYQDGIFKVTVSGSVSYGDPLVTDAVANMLKSGRALTSFQLSGTRIFGYALEDATTGQTCLMRLHPTSCHAS